ncbi:6-phosphogluconolactonase [bioreactor metagenome]|uniref:6-phosphogluconolactonase n=1 Tax=bioreactor metagenome TaxID=1076179 RepID=A0A645BVK3_9ZZZZ
MKNRLVFVGGYTQTIILGTGERIYGSGDGISVYRMDDVGRLTRLFAEATHNPTYLALSADGRFLYAVNELKEYHDEASSSVSAFSVHPKTGALTFLNRRMTGGGDACCLHLNPSGTHVMVANFSGGSFSVFPILADGSLGTASCFVQHYGHGANPARQASPHVHQTSADPLGKHLLVADLGTDEIRVYGIDWDSGLVSPNAAPAIPSDPGDGPRQFVFDQSGRFLYLVTELGNTIRVYDYRSETGTAKFLQTLSTLPAGCGDETIAAGIKLHPSGKFLYASNRGYDSIAVYRVRDDGLLDPPAIIKTGGRTPRDFCLTPDGEYLLSGFQDSNELILYRIDPNTGLLTESERTACNSVTAVLIADYE